MANDEKGKWITIKGTHIFIPDGKRVSEVLKSKKWDLKGSLKSKRTTKQINDEYNELSKKMQQDDYYYKPEDDRRLKNLRSEYDSEVARGQEDTKYNDYVDNLQPYEVYETAMALAESTKDWDLKSEINKRLDRIDRASRRGEGYANKPTNELREILKDNQNKEINSDGSVSLPDLDNDGNNYIFRGKVGDKDQRMLVNFFTNSDGDLEYTIFKDNGDELDGGVIEAEEGKKWNSLEDVAKEIIDFQGIEGAYSFIKGDEGSYEDALDEYGFTNQPQKNANDKFLEKAKALYDKDTGKISEEDYYKKLSEIDGTDYEKEKAKINANLDRLGVEKPDFLKKGADKGSYDDNYRGADYWELNDSYVNGDIDDEELISSLKNMYKSNTGVEKSYKEITGKDFSDKYVEPLNAMGRPIHKLGQLNSTDEEVNLNSKEAKKRLQETKRKADEWRIANGEKPVFSDKEKGLSEIKYVEPVEERLTNNMIVSHYGDDVAYRDKDNHLWVTSRQQYNDYVNGKKDKMGATLVMNDDEALKTMIASEGLKKYPYEGYVADKKSGNDKKYKEFVDSEFKKVKEKYGNYDSTNARAERAKTNENYRPKDINKKGVSNIVSSLNKGGKVNPIAKDKGWTVSVADHNSNRAVITDKQGSEIGKIQKINGSWKQVKDFKEIRKKINNQFKNKKGKVK